MQLKLSRSAQHLLIRGFFLVLALGSFYGVWDNRDFFLRPPFYIIMLIDFSLGVHFLVFGIFYNRLRAKYAHLFTHGVLFMWAYTIFMGIAGTVVHARALGLTEAVRMSGYATTTEFVLANALYSVVLPSIVFGVVLWVLHKMR